jgi:hypothetical protein
MNASTARYALRADLKALEPLRDLRGDLPTAFPTAADCRLRPLVIGIDKLLVDIAVAPGAEADQAAAVVRQVLRRYCRVRSLSVGAQPTQCPAPCPRRHTYGTGWAVS